MSNVSMGKRFGKPDIERVGLFSEMGFMNGKGYVPSGAPKYFKGANFLNSGRKSKNATTHGYFDDEFRRLYIGEAVVRKPKKLPSAPAEPFLVNTVPKKHSTPGDNYGTFTTDMPAFSAKADKAKYVHEPANFLWRCGKIGGPGYADSGLDKYPEHMPDPYGRKQFAKEYGKIIDGPFLNAIYPQPYFEQKSPYTETPLPSVGIYLDRELRNKFTLKGDWVPTGPAKWQGGSHAGCFDPYPEGMPCKYVTMAEANKVRGSGKHTDGPPFVPIPQMPKSYYTNSVMNQSVDVFMNTDNHKTYVPCYIKHLLTDMYS